MSERSFRARVSRSRTVRPAASSRSRTASGSSDPTKTKLVVSPDCRRSSVAAWVMKMNETMNASVVVPTTRNVRPRTVTLSIPGMSCAACPITVKKALMQVDGVSKVDIDLEKREATVSFDDEKASVEALTKATTEAGYPSTVKES